MHETDITPCRTAKLTGRRTPLHHTKTPRSSGDLAGEAYKLKLTDDRRALWKHHVHWYSTTAAMAAASSSITDDGRCPSFFMNLEVSTPLSCKASIVEVFERPFRLSGSIRRCQMFPLKWSCHPVMGATNLRGSRPNASELTMTAGRIFCISEPTVGSRLISQISPRLGDGRLVLNEVSTLEFAARCVLRIV